MTSIFFLFVFAFSTTFAQPLGAKFYTSTLNVKVGDKIYLTLKVNPKIDRPVYTVSASLFYDPSLVQFESAKLTDTVKVLPVPKYPYSLTDTANGMIRRTAGYPNGADTQVEFVNYTFTALAPGEAKISIEDGIALDVDNNDIGLQQKELTIKISDSIGEESKKVEFNFNLELLGPVAVYKEEDYTLQVYSSVGSTTPSKLKVYVYNKKAELFFSEEKNSPITAEEQIYFTIPANTLEVGEYVVSVESVGSDGSKQIVAQKTIGVLSNGKTWYTEHRYLIIPIFLFIVTLSAIHHFGKDRGIYGVLRRKKTVKKVVKKRRVR